MNETNSTTNAILVILLVIVVGFIVWFAVGRGNASLPANDGQEASFQVNLPGSNDSGTGAKPATN